MSYSPGKRLQFERDVIMHVNQPRIRRAPSRSGGRAVAIVAAIAIVASVLAFGGAAASRAGFFSTEKRSVSRMSSTLVKGLVPTDTMAALEACAQSTRGAQLVEKEEREAFGEIGGAISSSAEEQLAELRALRAELETAGANWTDVNPLSFAGVRARVEGDGMKRPLTVLTGDIFFRSAGKVFAIEISAWRCDGEFIIVDVWKGFPVDNGEAGIAAVANEQFAQFQQSTGENGGLDVSFAKQLQVEF